jgi:hypothetical protein
MAIFMTILGLAGAALCVIAYGLLSLDKINPKGMWYYVLNGLGGLFLLISIAYDYDSGDTGGVVIELCWVIISAIGILNVLRSKKHA